MYVCVYALCLSGDVNSNSVLETVSKVLIRVKDKILGN